MAKPISPSPIVEAFVRAVEEELPADQQSKLDDLRQAVENTTDSKDGHRARHCALWAIRLADEKNLSHPRWREISEYHPIWKDVWFGAEFAGMLDGAGRPAPIKDIEIEWVEDAVAVAKLVGEADGWEHALWESLLAELIEMEPKSASEPYGATRWRL